MCEKVLITYENRHAAALSEALTLASTQESMVYSVQKGQFDKQKATLKVATRGTLAELKEFLLKNGARFTSIISIDNRATAHK